MTVTTIVHSFSAGVISPALYGRVDLDKWHAAASVARNMVVSYTGGMFSRAGTAFVGPCRQQASASSNPPRNIEFTFNIFQSYILEFRDNYMCVVANGGYVTETPVAVTAATNANPVVVTAPGNNFQKEGAVSRVPQLDHGQGVGGEIAAVWGLGVSLRPGVSPLSDLGVPWLHTSRAVERVPVAFLKVARQDLAQMRKLRRRLESFVAADYPQAVRLLHKRHKAGSEGDGCSRHADDPRRRSTGRDAGEQLRG